MLISRPENATLRAEVAQLKARLRQALEALADVVSFGVEHDDECDGECDCGADDECTEAEMLLFEPANAAEIAAAEQEWFAARVASRPAP